VGQIVFDYTPGSGAATANLGISAVNLNGAVVTDVQSGLPADFSNAADAFLGVTVSCFGQGTRLATAAGEVAVERLAVGDEMRLAGGGQSRVVWLGHGVDRFLGFQTSRKWVSAALPIDIFAA
jgi:hypothetical protein